jgi:hypothetical protein
MRKKKAGRELVNAAMAGDMCDISGETYQWYVRTGKPAGNPPPGHVEVDNETGQRMYPAKEIRAWIKKRPGRGNWGGEGARARRKFQDAAPQEATPEHVPSAEETQAEAETRGVVVAPEDANDVQA